MSIRATCRIMANSNREIRTIRKVQMSGMVSMTIVRVNSLTKAKLTMNSNAAEITHNSLMILR
jgi:hypothetical protein